MPRIDTRTFSLLGEWIKPPKPKPKRHRTFNWKPDLTPRGQELFDAPQHNILCYGEKGSGKSTGADYKLVRHLFDNQHALAIIGVKEWGMAAKGGAWDKLTNEVLPAFKQGMELEYSDVWFDKQHHECIWVQNRFDSWCLVVLLSIPYGNMIRDRMPGYEPSFVLWDELTRCDSREYLTAVQAQLGRRPGVDGPQQYVGCCNPDDPDHWVHKAFFEEPFDEMTGEWDPDYLTIHFPVKDNEKNLQHGYLDRLKKAYKHDPTEYNRMIRGEWTARPSGDSLFGELYNPVIHLRPIDDDAKPKQGERLQPDKSQPMILGLDPGSVHNAIVFMQQLQIGERRRWVVFDEIVTIRRKIIYDILVPKIMERIRWWIDELGEDPGQVWISDTSAFNQFRAAQGTYDVLVIERVYEANREKYKLKPMKVKPAPKFNGSKIARVQLVQRLLTNDEFYVSAGCPLVQKMLVKLEAEKQEEGKPIDPEKALSPKRSDHLHVFDAMTYPMLLASLNPTALLPKQNEGFMLTVR